MTAKNLLYQELVLHVLRRLDCKGYHPHFRRRRFSSQMAELSWGSHPLDRLKRRVLSSSSHFSSQYMNAVSKLTQLFSLCLQKYKHEYPSALFQNDTIAATLIGAASVILFATSTVLMKNGHLVQWRKCSPPFVPTNFAEIGISGITLGRSNDAQFLDLHAAFIKACYCWVLRELFTEETQKECVSIVVETIWSSRCLKTWTMKLLTHFSSH